MLAYALIALLGAFLLLLVLRVGGAQRKLLLAHWPAVALAGAALFALARAQIWPALVLGVLAGLAWRLWPALHNPQENRRKRVEDAADVDASIVLGVSLDATEAEIRRAYRAKMASAHPDRGGAHAQAARLTAARDRLLRRLHG